MKLRNHPASAHSSQSLSVRSAFTLVEALVASTISLFVLSGTIAFIDFAAKSLSGATTQAFLNEEAGNTVQMLARRVRLATSATVDPSGKTLTLGFDDDFTKDSNGDGKPYNDQDHFEQFQVRDGDTNEKTIGDNALVYLPDAAQPANRILLRSGVRKLPNREIFAITNSTTVLINLGLADSYGRDWNQSVDIQLIAIPRNRTAVTNTISILP